MKYKCSECYHYACCDGLPYCNGKNFIKSTGTCVLCDKEKSIDELTYFKIKYDFTICSDCFDKYSNEEIEEILIKKGLM